MATSFTLSAATTAFVKKELTRYETPYSAIIPSLFKVQEENGWVPPAGRTSAESMMGFARSAHQ